MTGKPGTQRTDNDKLIRAIRTLLDEHYRLTTEKAEREINDKISLLGWKITLPRYPESIDEGPVFFTKLDGDQYEEFPEDEVPDEVRETYHAICDKYHTGEYAHHDEVEAAIQQLQNAQEKGPREPDEGEIAQLIEAYARHYGHDPENTGDTIRTASIAVWPKYMTGGPGYCGKVFMVVYDGSPSFFDVFTEEHDMSKDGWPKTGKLKKEERE